MISKLNKILLLTIGSANSQSAHTYSPTKQFGRALCTSRKERFRKVFAELFSKSDKEKQRFLFAKLFLLRLWCQKKKRKTDGWSYDGSAHIVRTNPILSVILSGAKRSAEPTLCAHCTLIVRRSHLALLGAFFVCVILSAVELRTQWGANGTQWRLGSKTKKFDSASLRSGWRIKSRATRKVTHIFNLLFFHFS